jgi:hypothetical protein
MTIEAAVFAAGSILIAALIWQTHQLTRRRLNEIHNDLDALKNLVSRLFVMGLNRKPEETAASGTESAVTQSDPVETKQTPVPSLELESELTQVDELCAKLITLAPPKEALPCFLSRHRARCLRTEAANDSDLGPNGNDGPTAFAPPAGCPLSSPDGRALAQRPVIPPQQSTWAAGTVRWPSKGER